MNIAFFGTSDRSTPILESLKKNFDLTLCITKTDSLVGRKQELHETEVKKWAKENKVDFVQVDTLKNDDLKKVIETLKKHNITYGVVADFSLIIPEELINHFQLLLNIHFSLLPKYRGASPVQFAILNGENTTGITYHMVDKGMDTGKVLATVEYNMYQKHTSGELYDILFKIAAENLPGVIKNYENGAAIPTEQDSTKATYTYSPSHPKSTFIYKEDAQINWSKSPDEIERAALSYNPWPIAWTTLAQFENSPVMLGAGLKLRASTNKELKLKIYRLDPVELQIEGKNKTDWKTFINGYCEKA